MESNLILTHAGLAVILFLCINWIGKHSMNAGYIQMSVFVKTDEAPVFNFLYRAFAPVVFITIVSAVSYTLKQDWLVANIFMVVVYHSFFRLAFVVVTGRAMLLNWGMQISYIILSIASAYYVYSNLIVDKEFFFPEPKDIGNALWLGVAGFVYHTCNSVRISETKTRSRKSNYLKGVYKKYCKAYGQTISEIVENDEQEKVVYAVLIYENFNRPKAYRAIENVLFHFGLAKTLGIMQVTTDRYINDLESVVLGSKKIVADFDTTKENYDSSYGSWGLRRLVLKSYNPDNDYISEVERIYEDLHFSFYHVHEDQPKEKSGDPC